MSENQTTEPDGATILGEAIFDRVRNMITWYYEWNGKRPTSIGLPSGLRRKLGEWCWVKSSPDGPGWDPLGEFRIAGVLIVADDEPESCPGEEGYKVPDSGNEFWRKSAWAAGV